MSRLPRDVVTTIGEKRFEVPVKKSNSATETGELTVMITFKLDKLNNDVTEGSSRYVNFAGKCKYEGGDDDGKEYCFRYYNLNSIYRLQRMSFYHFNSAGGLGAGAYVQERVAVGEWVTLVGRINITQDRISLSKNGQIKDCTTLSSYNIVPVATEAPFTFGRIKSSLKNHITTAMTFSDAAIWDRELTDREVCSLEKGLIPAGLVDWFLQF